MRIANPMYDAAFKYLMEDQAAARLLVGAVLGEEVVSLEALPQERAARPSPAAAPGEPPAGEMLTVRRVDFAATVRTATGERLRVLVEVQKARFTDELRVPGDRHVLEVDEREIPERYAPVLRRLEGAAASVEVADSMALEDEVAETWGRMKRESAAKDAALAARDAALAEKDAALAAQEAALERERAERAAAEERNEELARRLAELGGDRD